MHIEFQPKCSKMYMIKCTSRLDIKGVQAFTQFYLSY